MSSPGDRGSLWWTTSLLTWAAGCAGDATHASPAATFANGDGGGGAGIPSSADAGVAGGAQDVSGIVVSLATGRPLESRTVVVGGRRAITDGNGAFTLPGVAAVYDAVVVDPDGTVISVYRGLQRRDPLLTHAGAPTPAHAGSVDGDLSGGNNYPLAPTDLVTVQFVAPQANQFSPLGGLLSTAQLGPEYGPIPLQWAGPDTLTGDLSAFATFAAADGGASSWFVHQALTVGDGQTAVADLVLAQVTQVVHVSGTMQPGSQDYGVSKEAFYRLPIPNSRIDVPIAQGATFDDDVPDLGDAGAELCVGAVGTAAAVLTEQCGITPGQTPFALTLQAIPAVSSPADGAMVTKDTPLSWAGVDRGVYLLQFAPLAESAVTPRIDVFTAGTSAIWPDLTVAGVAFPSETNYEWTVGAFGPFASIDDALGPQGIGAPLPTEIRRSYSTIIHLATAP